MAPKKAKKEEDAAARKTVRVYISGLQGHHDLETGIAYHYRGHYIYAYPAANPIEVSNQLDWGVWVGVDADLRTCSPSPSPPRAAST